MDSTQPDGGSISSYFALLVNSRSGSSAQSTLFACLADAVPESRKLIVYGFSYSIPWQVCQQAQAHSNQL
jgi:hypothetical protein